MARRPPQLKQMKIAENSVQISADVHDRGNVRILVHELKKNVMHQVFGVNWRAGISFYVCYANPCRKMQLVATVQELESKSADP